MRASLDIVTEIVTEQDAIASHEQRLEVLKQELEDVVQMPYDEFIGGMRKLIAPSPEVAAQAIGATLDREDPR